MLFLLILLSGCENTDNCDFDNNIDGNFAVELEIDNEIVTSIIQYLEDSKKDIEYRKKNTDWKIQDIKSGAQPLLVDFHDSDTYYICAYYNGHHQAESIDLCCYGEYTWVKYESEKAIVEYYEGGRIITAFQLNVANVINEILLEPEVLSNEKLVPNFEHFGLYEPVFENGVNTNLPTAFDETFIYLNESDENTIYHATAAEHIHYNSTIPCIYINGQYYLKFEAAIIDKDGTVINKKIDNELNLYYYLWVASGLFDNEEFIVNFDDGSAVKYITITIKNFIYGITRDNWEDDPLLLSFFNQMKKEEINGKIKFSYNYQQEHIVAKEFGNYTLWDNPYIHIFIECDYSLAADEEWYKACENTEIKTLNSAFFAKYDHVLSNEHYSPNNWIMGLTFKYIYPENSAFEMIDVFYSDYEKLKSLLELDFITGISINYIYSLPKDYFVA